jgi:hypothetical protein
LGGRTLSAVIHLIITSLPLVTLAAVVLAVAGAFANNASPATTFVLYLLPVVAAATCLALELPEASHDARRPAGYVLALVAGALPLAQSIGLADLRGLVSFGWWLLAITVWLPVALLSLTGTSRPLSAGRLSPLVLAVASTIHTHAWSVARV